MEIIGFIGSGILAFIILCFTVGVCLCVEAIDRRQAKRTGRGIPRVRDQGVIRKIIDRFKRRIVGDVERKQVKED